MKTSIMSLFLLFIFTFYGRSFGQDLSGLFPFAHYTLINTPEDALGFQNDMQLMNTVYEGNDGIFFNGKHPFVDQSGAWARTYYMSALFDPKFAIQVEFRVDDLDGQFRCVVVCGTSILKEYLGFFIVDFDDFAILLSNGEFIDLPDVNPQENVWYKLTMVYDTVTNAAKFYLGSNLIESANHQLVRVQGDAFVNNLYLPAGYPIEGNWRNLRIYGSEEVTALEDELARAASLIIYPNPTGESLMIHTEDTRMAKWSIYDSLGKPLLGGSYQQQMQIDISTLQPGNFSLQFLDDENRFLCSKPFVKM